MTTDQPSDPLHTMPIMEHIIVLRTHLIRIVALLLILFLILLPFANLNYELLSAPLRAQLPPHSTMIATDVAATFMAPFKLNFYLALFLAMPYVLYEIWRFIKPALYQQEQRYAVPILIASIVFFYVGIAFAYFITLPAVLHFFVQASPDSVAPMTDINSYLSFCLKLFIVFGFTFEIPVVTFILIVLGILSTQSLINKRRFIIVGCFFISMFITPPDALSMLMLAVPMWGLFELGLWAGQWVERQREHTKIS